MNITLNIEAGNPAELQEAIVGLAGIVGFVTDGPSINVPENTPDKPDKPKRTTRSTAKVDKPAPKPEEEKPDTQPDDKVEADSNGDAPDPEEGDGGEDIPTEVDLRELASVIGKRGVEAKNAIKALLGKYGAPNVTAVPSEKRIAFKQELMEL